MATWGEQYLVMDPKSPGVGIIQSRNPARLASPLDLQTSEAREADLERMKAEGRLLAGMKEEDEDSLDEFSRWKLARKRARLEAQRQALETSTSPSTVNQI